MARECGNPVGGLWQIVAGGSDPGWTVVQARSWTASSTQSLTSVSAGRTVAGQV